MPYTIEHFETLRDYVVDVTLSIHSMHHIAKFVQINLAVAILNFFQI